MVTREQIIAEIKRVAELLEKDTLRLKEFELNSTIPTTTLRYFLGSWENALKEAGLKSDDADETSRDKEDVDKRTLMEELLRLFETTGQEPTPALCRDKGRYEERLYKKFWKNLHEAFGEAKLVFPDRFRPIRRVEVVAPGEVEDGTVAGGSSEEAEEKNGTGRGETDRPPIRFIPQTIRPREEKQPQRPTGDPFEFRGLKFAPVDPKGVMLLFGMVALELGFIIESLYSDRPEAVGRRCLNVEDDLWEAVDIHFTFLSSELGETEGLNPHHCLIVCWRHDLEGCPFEVLELREVISRI